MVNGQWKIDYFPVIEYSIRAVLEFPYRAYLLPRATSSRRKCAYTGQVASWIKFIIIKR